MVEYTLLVPLTDNEGISLAPTIRVIIDRTVQVFGGLTIGPECTGYWLDNGIVYTDTVRPFTIALPNRDDSRMVKVAGWWATQLRQHTLYLRCPDSAMIVDAVASPLGV